MKTFLNTALAFIKAHVAAVVATVGAGVGTIACANNTRAGPSDQNTLSINYTRREQVLLCVI